MAPLAFEAETSFTNVLARFSVQENSEGEEEEAEVHESPDSMDDLNSDEEGADSKNLSKKKLKKLTRLTVAQLKQFAAKPEIVEWEDATAKDPFILVQLKSVRCSVPVPGHWARKRKYLAGKRGFVKPPFELPQFIKDTGVMELREAARAEDATKRQKVKAREKMHPKLGKISVDYEKLHDAFYKYQTKPLLTGHGEMYYEGKEFEGRSRDARPGFLSEELRSALGMSSLSPPPWLINIQKYGPPPAYPHMRIPGYNAPIPEGAQWGFHPGGWGKPPVDIPVYGSGRADAATIQLLLQPVDRNIWGELEPDVEEESYEIEPDAEQEMSHHVHELNLNEDQADAFYYQQNQNLSAAEPQYRSGSFDVDCPEVVESRSYNRRR